MCMLCWKHCKVVLSHNLHCIACMHYSPLYFYYLVFHYLTCILCCCDVPCRLRRSQWRLCLPPASPAWTSPPRTRYTAASTSTASPLLLLVVLLLLLLLLPSLPLPVLHMCIKMRTCPHYTTHSLYYYYYYTLPYR